ncbi:heterokaryon incompatibility protein-domain-containing protein, partial [Hyaloscypha finlandica]
PECLSKAVAWKESCLSGHNLCRRQLEGKYSLPTRVLKVGNEFESPSLYITSEGEKGQWASLSYCWGGNSSFVLTKYTFHDMVHGQRLEAFPKTIHDAILITRALGIAFLWVDALCIFQGSIEDWENEAPKMEEVYSCAVLTIIA